MRFVVLALLFLIAGVGCEIVSDKSWKYRWLVIPAILLIAAAIICIVIPSVGRLTYEEWEQSFILMSNTFAFTELEDNSKYVYIWNIAEANRELFEFQASYLKWGEWSYIPSRVMDITPIG